MVTCCNAVFVLQGSPGLPSLAALHSNQILTVKVCLVEFDAAAAAPRRSVPPSAQLNLKLHRSQNCAVGFDDSMAKIKATLCSGHTTSCWCVLPPGPTERRAPMKARALRRGGGIPAPPMTGSVDPSPCLETPFWFWNTDLPNRFLSAFFRSFLPSSSSSRRFGTPSCSNLLTSDLLTSHTCSDGLP